MITKPDQHEIDRAGKRLLRGVLEPLKWVVNDVQEDYGIDGNVQVFDGEHPTGAWFHVQLKSSASSEYSAKDVSVSQGLSVDHARHYALEMRQPIFLIHADVTAGHIFWHAPQLDNHLVTVLTNTRAQRITIRIPTRNRLPETAPELLGSLDDIYLLLGNRELASASIQSFAESLSHLPDQEALHRAFQEKNDSLKLQRIFTSFHQKKLDEARTRAEAVLIDPDSTIEIKFWAQMSLQSIDYTQTVQSGKPQSELSKLVVAHAKSLQKLTARGPKYLKFYSLVARQAAELEVLTHEDFTLFMALSAHLQRYGNPMMALGLIARRTAITRRIASKYNQCVRLARYAAEYPDRWMLGRALANIPRALGVYMLTLRTEGKFTAEEKLWQSALQVLKLAVSICRETGDAGGVVLVITSALATASSTDSQAFHWASQVAESIVDQKIRDDALLMIERVTRRWKGEAVEGDYRGNTIWQAIQNMATALGIDTSDENDPFVRGLNIAANDDSPERVLARCEHILVTQGAIGPIARRIQTLFNTSRASSKVIHCTLHNFHVDGKELDGAYDEFKLRHCDSCPDKKPRPENWQFTHEEELKLRARHREFMERLVGTPFGFRFTNED
jgi:hypothetical protein